MLPVRKRVSRGSASIPSGKDKEDTGTAYARTVHGMESQLLNRKRCRVLCVYAGCSTSSVCWSPCSVRSTCTCIGDRDLTPWLTALYTKATEVRYYGHRQVSSSSILSCEEKSGYYTVVWATNSMAVIHVAQS